MPVIYMMKILTSDTPPYFIDLEAPTLPADPVEVDGRSLWRVWCRYCNQHHFHGPAEGHREAHCQVPTPYQRAGYNLALCQT